MRQDQQQRVKYIQQILKDRNMDSEEFTYSISTKFMQDYRIRGRNIGGKNLIVLKDTLGISDIFTLDESNNVIITYPDEISPTGYNTKKSDLHGEYIASGITIDDAKVVFAASGNVLKCMVRYDKAPGAWGDIQLIDLSGLDLRKYDTITGIYTTRVAGKLHIALRIKRDDKTSGTGFLYAISTNWNFEHPEFELAPIPDTVNCCGWTVTNSSKTVLNGWSPKTKRAGEILQYDHDSGDVRTFSISTLLKNIETNEIVALSDANVDLGMTNYFAVLDTGTAVYTAVPMELTLWLSFLDDISNLDKIYVKYDDAKVMHVFASSKDDGPIWHTYHSGGESAGWSPAVQIAQNATYVDFVDDIYGVVELYTLSAKTGQLKRLGWSLSENEWSEWLVEAPRLDEIEEIEEIEVYNTEITIVDSTGNPLRNGEVIIIPSAATELTVNGRVRPSEASTFILASTNALGGLSIVQSAKSLKVPNLRLCSPEHGSININLQQYKIVSHELNSLTGDRIRNAKDAKGKSILLPEYNKHADVVADAISTCISSLPMSNQLGQLKSKEIFLKNTELSDKAEVRITEEIQVADDYKPWKLNLSSDNPRYSLMSPEDIESYNQYQNGIKKWFGTTADFIRNISRNVFEVVQYVVTRVSDGLLASITFFADGETYIYTRLIKLVSDIYDIIESIFSTIKIGFRKLFEWLGELFDWDNILRTKEVLSHVFMEGTKVSLGAFDKGMDIVSNNVSKIAASCNEAFDAAFDKFKGTSMNEFATKNRSPFPFYLAQSMSHNILQQRLISTPPSLLFLQDKSSETELRGKVNQLVKDTAPELSKRIESDYFKTTTKFVKDLNLGDVAVDSVIDLLRTITAGTVSGAKFFIDSSLDLLKFTTHLLFDHTLNKPIRIPFLSEFVRKITDSRDDVTLLDIIALVAAIPCTAYYKMAFKKAPFPDVMSVNEFKGDFNGDKILSASGLGKYINGDVQPFSKKTVEIMRRMGVFIDSLAGAIGALTCWSDPGPYKEHMPKEVAIIQVLFGYTACFLLIPDFTLSNVFSLTTPTSYENQMWLYSFCTMTFDLVNAVIPTAFEEPVMSTLLFLKTVIGIGFVIYTLQCTFIYKVIKFDGADFTATITPAIVLSCSFLDSIIIQIATQRISHYIYAAVLSTGVVVTLVARAILYA